MPCGPGAQGQGPRMDAVFYLRDALRLSPGESLEEIREISFEIGMLGRHGLDISGPKETHVLRALLGGRSRAGADVHNVCGLHVDRAGVGYRGNFA